MDNYLKVSLYLGCAVPFRIMFLSDQYEFVGENGNGGFRLSYTQDNFNGCN